MDFTKENISAVIISAKQHTTQQIQSMNVLRWADCGMVLVRRGEPIATRKEWRERRAPFFAERHARRSYQYKTTRNNSLKPEPWRKPEGCN